MRTTVILICLGLILAACPAEDPSEKPTCGPNGTYVEADGGAYCDCGDPCSYMQGEGFTCVAVGQLQTGHLCTEDCFCDSGRCLERPGEEYGYCTTTNCVTNSDCVNHATGETAEMCCVEVAVDYRICLKIAEGYECGDGTGTCGASCTGTLESACALGFPCLYSTNTDPWAQCSKPCESYLDCQDCVLDAEPDARALCTTVSGGEKFCFFDGGRCSSSMGCSNGDTCSIGVSADMTDFFGECMNVGALPPGSPCNDEDDPTELSFEERCSGFYCFGGKCTEVCADDSTCPEGMSCMEHTFEQVDDSIMVCKGD
ncbi:MAG: hypothetical protein JRF33_05100 [Deltaproteobacteria bacterium]|nr:hypothetical protein [Deltaproteobacteria bacterium]